MSTLLIDALQPFEHHQDYFLPGGDLYLVAGNVLFCIHSYFFVRDSPKFREILRVVVAPNQPRPGSESSPIRIENSSSQEFAKFLWVFYNFKYSVYNASTTEWIGILKIACEYGFVEAKHLAIRGLEQCNLSIVRRLTIYQDYYADQMYIVPLFAELCTRDEGPSDEETDELGDKTSLLIYRMRDRLRSMSPANDEDITKTICSFLGVEPEREGSLNNSVTSKGADQPDKSKKKKQPNGTSNGASGKSGGN